MSKIRIKRGNGTPPQLDVGEPAIDLQNKKLYIGNTNANIEFMSGNPIISVRELPQSNIDENVTYRLLKGTLVCRGFIQNQSTVIIVSELPNEGENVTTDRKVFTLYYNLEDKNTYGYVSSELATVLEIPSGWYNASTLAQSIGSSYGGVITDISQSEDDDTMYLLLEYEYYKYVNGVGWIGENKSSIGWHGTAVAAEVFNNPTLNIASGNVSHAEGNGTTASGESSHAEGWGTTASGSASHAEGERTTASGEASHAEGANNQAIGQYSHAEGLNNKAISKYSSVKGNRAIAGCKGYWYSSVELNDDGTTTIKLTTIHDENMTEEWSDSDKCGYQSNDVISIIADGKYYNCATIKSVNNNVIVVKENLFTTLNNPKFTFDDGFDGNIVYAISKPDVGYIDLGIGAMAEGGRYDTDIKLSGAFGPYSHAEGRHNQAIGHYSHAEGRNNQAINTVAHVEGQNSIAQGMVSHAEGSYAKAIGNYSHAEGSGNTASGNASHVEGNDNKAYGNFSHAEGWMTQTSDFASHSEGRDTLAQGAYSHAEGYNNQANEMASHVEGEGNIANGMRSHAEGIGNTASGGSSHAEGSDNIAEGGSSHAEGHETVAEGYYSHTEGYGTVAIGNIQHVQGRFNIKDEKYAHIVGNGSDGNNCSNAHTLDWNGNAWFAGNVTDGTGNVLSSKANTTDVNNSISQVESIAKGANKAITFNDYTAFCNDMITRDTGVKTTSSNDYLPIGNNILIKKLEIPDLWIYGHITTKVTTVPTESEILNALQTNGYFDIGYVRVAQLETQKVNLNGYATESYVNSKISSVYRVKGTLNSATELASIVNPQIGDVYNINADDHFFGTAQILNQDNLNVEMNDFSYNDYTAYSGPQLLQFKAIFDNMPGNATGAEINRLILVFSNNQTLDLSSSNIDPSATYVDGNTLYTTIYDLDNILGLDTITSSLTITAIQIEISYNINLNYGDNVVWTEPGMWDKLSGNIDLSNYVTKTGYATSSTGGSVKVTNNTYGLTMSSGNLTIAPANVSDITSKTHQYKPIVPYYMAYAMQANTHQSMSDSYNPKTLTSGYLSILDRGKLPASYNAVKNYIDSQICNAIGGAY